MFKYCEANAAYRNVQTPIRAKSDKVLSQFTFNYGLFDEKGIPCGNYDDFAKAAKEAPDKLHCGKSIVNYDCDGDFLCDMNLFFNEDDGSLYGFDAKDNSTGDWMNFFNYGDDGYIAEVFDHKTNIKYTENYTGSLISDSIKTRKYSESYKDENGDWVKFPNLYEKLQAKFLDYAAENLIE